ncbi:MAG: MBL fold metallo-hydrolase [Gammaproteobacteria bacterium]|nr:MBL fold metallo-hydrolase [Gammaproteobacteria bacterium]
MHPKQVPGYYRMMLGAFEITALHDGGIGIDSALMRGNQAEIQSTLARALIMNSKEVPGSVVGFLVNTGSKLVLIDAGAGGHWGGPALGRLVSNLKAAGYRPDQVDLVLVTHLHADHVGGIYDSKGNRVFKNAEIMMKRADSNYWLSKEAAAMAPEAAQIFFTVARDAAKPYLAAGKWKPFEGTPEIVPGIRPKEIAGHTPGHVGYEVESQGQKLLIWGDVVHMAAVQMPHPEVGIVFDVDGPTAIKSRAALFAELAEEKTLVGGAHIPFPSLGRLRKEETGYTWLPVTFMNLK